MFNIPKLIAGGVAAIFALSIFFGSFYTIDQGARGVILRNGAIIGEAGPGLHWKVPFTDSVEEISVQSQKATYDKIPVYSRDQQTATLRVSMNFRVSDVSKVYAEYRNTEMMLQRLVAPRVTTWAENIFGQYQAAQAVQQRAKLNNDVGAAIRKAVSGPFVIESIQVENLDFDDAYEKNIRDQMAQVVALRTAESVAARRRTEADAAAYATKAQGDAQAAAIRARGDALRQNPGIPELVAAEKWDGKLPTTMPPGSAVPFLSIGR